MLKRAIVVGASSGIGAALVRRLAREGHKVVAVARRREALDALAAACNTGPERRVIPYVYDVKDTAGAQAAFDACVAALDGLDLVVYCAGVMPAVGPDQFDTAIDREIFEVNVLGALAWLNPAATRFQVQKGGMIVGVGSVAGDRGRRGNPAYHASKAALHTFLESLRNRLSQHGVHVLTVKPGPVRTPMTAGRDKLPLIIDVEDAAEGIWSAIVRRADTAYVPATWGAIMPVIQHVPSLIFRRMNF